MFTSVYKTLLVFILILDGVYCCKYYSWNPFSFKTDLHVSILVLARGGSKGIELKNIAKVGGVPLIRISLEKIKNLNEVDSIWVSTDHLEIAHEVEKENVNIHWRAPDSATDTATSIKGVEDFLKYHPEVDILGLVQCTSPFVDSVFLQKAVNFMKAGAECVFSVTRSHKLLWRDLDQRLVPINFNPNKRPRKQDWAGDLQENGMFYFTVKELLQKGTFQSQT